MGVCDGAGTLEGGRDGDGERLTVVLVVWQDRMSTRMEGFHSYFRQSFKQIW